MGSLILSMSCTYLRYIIHTSQELTGVYRNSKASGKNHPLSSEGNRSPLQLYTSGMLENELSGYAGVESVLDFENAHDYGFDPAGPFPVEDEDYQVVVPETFS